MPTLDFSLGLGIAFGSTVVVARAARRRPASIDIQGLYYFGSRTRQSQGSFGISNWSANSEEDRWSSSDEDDVPMNSNNSSEEEEEISEEEDSKEEEEKSEEEEEESEEEESEEEDSQEEESQEEDNEEEDSEEEESEEEEEEDSEEEEEEVREESSSMTHYAQESEERMPTNEFEYKGGKAVRDKEFTYAWVPARPYRAADRKAAFEAAKKEAERKARSMVRRMRPAVIAVLQGRRGNAICGLSTRGQDRQVRFQMTMGSRQRQRLDSIPEKRHGRGHGWCAEQSVTHNASVIRQRQRRNNVEEARRMFLGQCTITVYGRGRGGRYNERLNACSTCRVTNEMYDFDDDAFEVSISSESSEDED